MYLESDPSMVVCRVRNDPLTGPCEWGPGGVEFRRGIVETSVMQIGKNGVLGPAAAAVLAGGRSRRMGRDKARLEWGDTSMLGHVLSLVRGAFEAVYLSARTRNSYRDFGLPVVEDRTPNAGPLGGIVSVFEAVEHDWLFVTACDMPFAEPEVWRALADRVTNDVDVVMPRTALGLEPLCAFYHRRCLPVFEDALAAGIRSIRDACRGLRVVEVDMRDLDTRAIDPFANLNTPADFTASRPGAETAPGCGPMDVHAKVWLERDGATVFGGGRTALLRRIQDTGSINKAAAELQMSYRRALGRIRQMEEGLGYALVERRTGGRDGGGSKLTPAARELLDRFEAVEAELDAYVAKRFASVFGEVAA